MRFWVQQSNFFQYHALLDKSFMFCGKVRRVISIILVIGIIAVLTLLFQPNPANAQWRFDESLHLIDAINRFENFVLDTMQRRQLPGLAVTIVKGNQIAYLNSFGVKEVGGSDPIDIHTVFRLGSVSKGFAGVLTGVLVNQGILNWDDKVTKYLPNFRLHDAKNTQNLTLRHLLNHTTGLPQHTYTDLVEQNLTFSEMAGRLSAVPLIAPVGKIYSYQNVIYSIIGDVVQAATGKSYQEQVSELIFEPLGMFDASLGKDGFLSSNNRALPHIQRNGEWITAPFREAYYNVLPAAGVNASIYDMAQWLRAMMGGAPSVIPPRTIEEVTTPSIRSPRERWKHRWRDRVRDAHYGLGWRIYDYAGHKLVYHGGWIQGYRAEIGFLPEQKIGIAVLMNFESLVAIEFLPTFFDIYLNLYFNGATEPAN